MFAGAVTVVGSIKWLEHRPFDARDLARLITHRDRLPGADEDTPLLAVSRSGAATEDVRVVVPLTA